MDKKEISDRIKGILVDDLFVADSVDEINDEAQLGIDLGLDSVGFTELGTIVGEIFDIKVTDADVGEGHFSSVKQLTDFVHARTSGSSAATKVEAEA